MAENLFSKYRPSIFDEVYGHDKIKQELKQRSIKNDFPKVAYFEGRSGTGKNCLEKIYSKSILCQHKDANGNPCNKCEQCLTVIYEKPSNYYLLYNASNLGVDETREIEDIANKKTLSIVKDRLIIIDELQEILSSQKALKNLLKLLEKPQSHTYIVLLSMNGEKIPASIKNRCVPYKLKDLTLEEIANYLYYICEQEGIKVDTEEKAKTLIAIADNSFGSMRTAVSYLERCIYSNIWSQEDLIKELNLISTDTLTTLVNYILIGNINALQTQIDKDILDRIRNVLNILYKKKNGLELEGWRLNQIKGVAKVSTDVVKSTIEQMNTLIQYPYLTQELIDFTIINTINKNKVDSKIPLLETAEEIPKRRKKVE